MGSCLVCERISQIKAGTNPCFVVELDTGFVVIGDHQYFKGYTLFLCKEHHVELHELALDVRWLFLKEMSLVAEAVFRAFKPEKMNYELLGNADGHMHWHLFPRHVDDPSPQGPVWMVDKTLRNGDATRPSTEELSSLKEKLLQELTDMGLVRNSHA